MVQISCTVFTKFYNVVSSLICVTRGQSVTYFGYYRFFVMLCLQSWCGALPPRFGRYSQKLQVFSKLGGNFLGLVAKPCSKSLQDATTAYITLRGMQAKAALLLKHEYLPPRYLALYVGSCRITCPSFPFKDCLDQKLLGFLDTLHGAERIDVVYDGDTDFCVARASLQDKGLLVCENDIKVVVHSDGMCFVHTPINALVQPELDVWAFNKNIRHLVFWWPARTIGDLRFFPDLTGLSMLGSCSVQDVDFGSLASSCKSLQTLDIRLEVDPSNLLGINKLCSLEHLGVVACGSGKATIPREVGSLSKLGSLTVRGQQITGQIPTEIGQLGGFATSPSYKHQADILHSFGIRKPCKVVRIRFVRKRVPTRRTTPTTEQAFQLEAHLPQFYAECHHTLL